MDLVLIDTDVILDIFFDRKPYSEFATEILNQCEAGAVKGYVTPVIICNVYYLLRKAANHKTVIEKVKQLLSIIDVLTMDQEVVFDALNSKFNDFEDALQNFTATKNQEITVILTRNVKDYKHSTLAILTPETYLKGKI